MLRLSIAVACLCLLGTMPANAAVERYAVVIANNSGTRGEVELRYAEQDAAKLADVLRDLGGFRPENMTMLRGEDAETVRRALIVMNDRIRARVSDGTTQAVLFVYYSGHADATALHLGDSTLELAQLEGLVSGSSATVRLLVLDSCRSGSLTRVKGGKAGPPVLIRIDERLPGVGAVVLTSSSASEDSQESDDLKGSFFTHYLVSGLVGAADADADGRVTLNEAYRYAYNNTLRASSTTLAGLQHPTFHYQLRGQGDLVMTFPAAHTAKRATLVFPAGRSYLVMAQDEEGAVVAEVAAYDRTRTISVRPGRYHVRGRGTDYLLEGRITVAAGDTKQVADAGLSRIAYARLVRKGRGDLHVSSGPQAGYRIRTELWDQTTPCHGAFAGYAFDFETVSLVSRMGLCRSIRETQLLKDTADEADLELRVGHAWDLPVVTAELSVAAGASMLRRTFATEGMAPSRLSGAVHVAAGLGLSAELGNGFYVATDLDAQTYIFREQSSSGDRPTSVATRFTLRGSLGLGKHF